MIGKKVDKNIGSKVIQYKCMNTSIVIFDRCTFKIVLINENHFQFRTYFNKLVRIPRQVISNNGSILYYKMNKKSIDGTSVMTLKFGNSDKYMLIKTGNTYYLL